MFVFMVERNRNNGDGQDNGHSRVKNDEGKETNNDYERSGLFDLPSRSLTFDVFMFFE